MLRIGLDFAEKRVSEELNVPDDKIFLYHADFLGIFNEAAIRIRSRNIKLVQIVFAIIAIPAGLLYIWAAIQAQQFFVCRLNYAVYLLVLGILPTILTTIHIKCVIRERKFKQNLGIVSKVSSL